MECKCFTTLLVSAVERSKPSSVHTCPLPREPPPTLLAPQPSGPLQGTRLSSLSFAAGPRWLAASRVVVVSCPSLPVRPALPFPPVSACHSLGLGFCSCPGTRFISTVFLDYTNVLIDSVWFSLFNLLHSMRQALGPSTSLNVAQLCSFLWLSNTPLHVCTTSLPIHLSMDIWVVSMSWLL